VIIEVIVEEVGLAVLSTTATVILVVLLHLQVIPLALALALAHHLLVDHLRRTVVKAESPVNQANLVVLILVNRANLVRAESQESQESQEDTDMTVTMVTTTVVHPANQESLARAENLVNPIVLILVNQANLVVLIRVNLGRAASQDTVTAAEVAAVQVMTIIRVTAIVLDQEVEAVHHHLLLALTAASLENQEVRLPTAVNLASQGSQDHRPLILASQESQDHLILANQPSTTGMIVTMDTLHQASLVNPEVHPPPTVVVAVNQAKLVKLESLQDMVAVIGP